MTRITKKAAKAAALAAEQAALLAAEQAEAETEEAEEAEQEEEILAPRSVVAAKYKSRYRARANSNKGRNCADWLAQTLVPLTIGPDGKADLMALSEICAANRVSSAYENRTKGWEGRMRMTLGLRLRPVVAEQGFLALPDGEQVAAPDAFLAAWRR